MILNKSTWIGLNRKAGIALTVKPQSKRKVS